MAKEDEGSKSDFEQSIEKHLDLLTDPKKGKATKKEAALHAARPGLVELPEELAQQFYARWNLIKKIHIPKSMPQDYVETFSPLVEKYCDVPPLERQEVISFDLWTQHLVHFRFNYAKEIIDALLWLSIFKMLSPPPEALSRYKAEQNDDIERARITRELVEHYERDVALCLEYARELFINALRGRLGTVLTDACSECAIRAINDKLPELNCRDLVNVKELRSRLLKNWEMVEKVRLDTPSQGGKAPKADLTRLALYYDDIVGVWRESFELCRTALRSQFASRKNNWRDEISRTFADFIFPDDLMERLQPMPYWPELIANICEEKGGEDKPEDIALEHAARLCGSQEYSYKLSSLRENYNRQKRIKI